MEITKFCSAKTLDFGRTTLLYFLVGLFFHECTSSSASSTEQSSKAKENINVCSTPKANIDYKSLQNNANPAVLQMLNFPKTVSHISLTEPQFFPKNKGAKNIPAEMVLIPAGNVRIGDKDGFAHELPQFWASVESFLMDKSPVTIGQFRAFIKATNYQTEADKFGNAGVINDETGKSWTLLDGANWEYPLGKNHPKAEDNHPVTQVSWNDANAYAKWAGKRLPCEIEWEHAARNAKNNRTKYPWGNEIQAKGKWNANIWQGKFPLNNFVEDKYAYTSPVGIFGKTALGLTDMSGNVWQWTSNKKFNYESLFKKDISEIALTEEYAERGGSFLCEPTWCHGYRVSGRSSSSSETSLFHLGFRCVKDIN
ncbi:sulfatase modifying factor 1 [Arcicella aurantiaca]|uniref:Sulfatase modifying factor 1 n=1 Tax=Arcicella aurantiaca TaxID=591202 RepID=A0A316DWQ0_9BACT|nr:SUMF1/EgtB/PvdO family nonheme iron enzyme [Arcicella aurantiaca]PWK21609.1 sulfatase modifying factor 1 [Arcicella aurantiaca]